ncbi:MAG TPA: cytochrome c [Rhodopila sp.]|jgi:mono/diheme cytochrome c family protein|nr:cytochrome c [Rhodopila sp.]
MVPILHGLAAGVLFIASSAVCLADTTSHSDAASIQRGAYLAKAADCTACHTAPGGLPFAGGLPIKSPVGTIYSTNITPSLSAGIGGYSEAEFDRAIRQGIRRDGANLYPAMPYTSYQLLSDADVHDLYNYFHYGVAPVNVASHPTSLPFPMNIRMSMKVWNLLFFSGHRFTPDPHQSAEWNRGAYLVNGAAHCDTCHTPRGFLMQELSGQTMAGSQVGSWYAPNVTSDPVSGIGSWSQQDIAHYLKTGILLGNARAAGNMGEAVEHSFQYLTQADLEAIATYVHTIPAVHDPAATQSRFSYGAPSIELATLRGENPIRSFTGPSPTGAELFSANCASCHEAFGQGSKDGYYPSLFHNSVTAEANPSNLIATILFGVNRTTAAGQAYMPGFGGKATDPNQLDNHEIASLANYVFAQYGRAGIVVSEDDVVMVRQGGPSSPLVLLARIGMGVGAVVVILLILFFSFRPVRRSQA